MGRCVFLLFFILIAGCSGIKILNQEDLYSKTFLNQLESARVIFKDGDKRAALAKLKNINDTSLSKEELAKKYNLVGVFNFSQGNTSEAIKFFEVAKTNVKKDLYLYNQIHLNLASSYYKNGNYDYAKSYLKGLKTEYFSEAETQKFHKLNFSIAEQVGDSRQIVDSLMFLSKDLQSFSDVEDYQYRDLLKENFNALSSGERVYLLEDHEKENPYVTAYLGKIEATNRFYSGDRDGALSLVSWLKDSFGSFREIQQFADSFSFKAESFSKIQMGSIGVVVPLSGKFAKFGKRALAGINTALGQKKYESLNSKVYVRDNKRNSHLARERIRELVTSQNVSAIIGGIYPDLAREEYLEAKKYGVLYISISPVHLPKEEKNHLLIEVSGSVESQVERLMGEDFLNSMGRNVAVLYPNSQGGKTISMQYGENQT